MTSEHRAAEYGRIVDHVLVPPAGTFEIDPVHTFVGFRAQHLVVGRVRGRFDAVAGTITRRDFGLTYELVKGAGGLLVGQDIDVEIDAEAVRPL